MPYSNTWSNVVPAGSVAANLIDDHIRQLRLDIQERMDDLVADWTADPIVPKFSSQRSTSAVGTGALTTEVDLHSFTLAANSLGATGGIRVVSSLVGTGAAAVRRVRLRFGGIEVLNFGATTAGELNFTAYIFNRGTTNSQFTHAIIFFEGSAFVITNSTLAIDTTASVIVRVTGETLDAADEITAELTIMEILA